MKYIPIANSPNVSESNLVSSSPSLKIDDRGFPHISWLENGNGINIVRYSYWDGIQWNYKDTPSVYISSEDIMFSPNSLLLDEDYDPCIVLARKLGSGTRLSLLSYSDSWSFNTLDVNYSVSWIGITKNEGILESSGSMSTSSSSSSSSYSGFYNVTVYDSTNASFKVYAVDSSGWTLMGTEAAVPDSCIKITSCGNRIGVGFIDEDLNIQCGFFDLDLSSWVSFTKLAASITYDSIIDMDLAGYSLGNESIIFCTWLSDGDSFVVGHALLNDSLTEWYEDSDPIIENNTKDIVSTYIVNGYKKITICLDAGSPYIFALGSSAKLFTYDSAWVKTKVDIEGISNGIAVDRLVSQFYSDSKISLSADSGDVYFFEKSVSSGFELMTPDIVLLTDSNSYRATYANGLLSGADITNTSSSICGDILRDSVKPLFISSNQ